MDILKPLLFVDVELDGVVPLDVDITFREHKPYIPVSPPSFAQAMSVSILSLDATRPEASAKIMILSAPLSDSVVASAWALLESRVPGASRNPVEQT